MGTHIAKGELLHARLFLEGIEVPVISASVSASIGSCATAQIEIVPTDRALYLSPRTLVHLFYCDYDQYEGTTLVRDPETDKVRDIHADDFYRLLFAGEVFSISYSKAGFGSRGVVLSCRDFSNQWDTNYHFQMNFKTANPGSAYLGNQNVFLGASASIFDDIVSKPAEAIRTLLTQRDSAYNPALAGSTGTLGGLLAVLELVGGVQGAWYGVNDFATIQERRVRLMDQLGSDSGKTAADLFAASEIEGFLTNSLGDEGTVISFRQVMNLICGYIYYDIVPQPTGFYIHGDNSRPVITKALVQTGLALPAGYDLFAGLNPTYRANSEFVGTDSTPPGLGYSAKKIIEVFREKGIPDPVIAAAIVNAVAESGLVADKQSGSVIAMDRSEDGSWTYKGDYLAKAVVDSMLAADTVWEGGPIYRGKENSFGLFQLFSYGGGKGMSNADRKDPIKNCTAILKDHGVGKVLAAYNSGCTDVGILTYLWAAWVERPGGTEKVSKESDVATALEIAAVEPAARSRTVQSVFTGLVHGTSTFSSGKTVTAANLNEQLADKIKELDLLIEAKKKDKPDLIAEYSEALLLAMTAWQNALAALQVERDELQALLDNSDASKPRERLITQILRPDTWFVAPPSCNVIFPEEYTSFSYSREMMMEVTRLQLLTSSQLIDGSVTNGTEGWLVRTFFAPTFTDYPSLRVGGVGSAEIPVNYPHEKFSGTIPRMERMSDVSLYAKLREATGKEGQDSEHDQMTKIEQYAAAATHYNLLRYRYQARSASVTGKFTPRIVAGFPMVVVSRPVSSTWNANSGHATPVHFIGLVAGISHSLSQSGGQTSIQLSHVRSHKTGDDTDDLFAKSVFQKSSALTIQTTLVESDPKKPYSLVGPFTDTDDSMFQALAVVAIANYMLSALELGIPLDGTPGKNGEKVADVGLTGPTGHLIVAITILDGTPKSFEDGVDVTGISLTSTTDLAKSYPFTSFTVTEDTTRRGSGAAPAVTPLEDAIQPPWFSDEYKNANIGTDIYRKLLGCGSIVDGHPAGVESAIDSWVADYSHVSGGGQNSAAQYIYAKTSRPGASLRSVLFRFHLQAWGAKDNLEGLDLDVELETYQLKGVKVKVDPGMDPRRERHSRVADYVSELKASVGIRG